MATRRGLELARRIWQWQPHSIQQRDFMLCPARVKTAACGRRWGKSESTAVDIALFALEEPGTTQIITAPTADQTGIIMGEVSRRLNAVPGLPVSFSEKKSPYWEIVFHDSHALREPTRIISRTAGPTGRGLRGRKAHRVIEDEAAFIADAINDNVITPLLADYDGQLIKTSTPDGVGDHFHKTFLLGLEQTNPRYASFQFPTASNPYISPAYLANEEATKPELVFAQEYLARFLDREGAVFRKVMACATATLQTERQRDKRGVWDEYVFGVDWGRTGDFTVIGVFDMTTRELVALDRFNQIDFALQRTRLKALYERFQPVVIVAEANSIGQPNIEALQADNLPVQPFTTSNASKAEIVDTLALAFERQDIAILDDPVLTAELMSYQAKKLPSGLLQYGAPDGQHDDTVIALALSVWGASHAGVSTAPSIW